MCLRVSRHRVAVFAALVFFAVCIGLVALPEPLPQQRLFIASLMLCTFGALKFLSLRKLYTCDTIRLHVYP